MNRLSRLLPTGEAGHGGLAPDPPRPLAAGHWPQPSHLPSREREIRRGLKGIAETILRTPHSPIRVSSGNARSCGRRPEPTAPRGVDRWWPLSLGRGPGRRGGSLNRP